MQIFERRVLDVQALEELYPLQEELLWENPIQPRFIHLIQKKWSKALCSE